MKLVTVVTLGDIFSIILLVVIGILLLYFAITDGIASLIRKWKKK